MRVPVHIEIERRVGASVRPFFDQWLHRPGWVDLTVSWTWRAETSTLLLQVQQGTRFAPFEVPLRLEIRDTAGHVTSVVTRVAAQGSQLIMIRVPGVKEVSELSADLRVELLGKVTLLHAMP